MTQSWSFSPGTHIPLKNKKKLAHPTRFERVTFAFGGQGLLEKACAAPKIRPINRSAVLVASLPRVFLL
jgi:hypothetical protein